MRNLLAMTDLSSPEIERIFAITTDLKSKFQEGLREPLLPGWVMAMLFEKPSLRTRVSFEAAMAHLGGTAMFLGNDVGFGSRESVADFARVLGEYADVIVIRAKRHETAVQFAEHASCPVLNGLTDYAHPCQAMADLYTIGELVGKLEGHTLAWIGDGNNVARSLAVGCGKMGLRFAMATPEGYRFGKDFLALLAREVPDLNLHVTADPVEAVRDAVVVYTDVWTSMGQEKERAKRLKAFKDFQINEKLCSKAKKDYIIMHCLPAHRGEEISDESLESPHSVVFDQAENRLHVEKAVLLLLLK